MDTQQVHQSLCAEHSQLLQLTFKRVQIRHPHLENHSNKVSLLKLGEQRQPHTRNCPTITLSLSVVSSAVRYTLLYIWHFDFLTLHVCVSVD